MKKLFHKIIHYIGNKAVGNKYLLQDKHSFKPMLIEIEDRPVSPVGNFILWTIIIVFFLSLAGLYIAKIDVVVTARGKLIPSGDVKTVQATYNGVITKILVKEGDIVKKGDILIKTDINIIQTKILSTQEEYNNLLIKERRLNAHLNKSSFSFDKFMNKKQYTYEQNIFENENQGLSKKKAVVEAKTKGVKEQIEIILLEKNSKMATYNLEKLKEKQLKKVIDIIPRINYETTYYKVLSLKQDIKSYANKFLVLNKKLKELEYEKKLLDFTAKSKYYTQIIETRKKIDEAKSQLITLNLQKNKYDITSPVDGYILKLDINTLDAVVTPAQKLLTIVPHNVKMIAQVDVLNKDIGFIFTNMETLIKVDTFDFQKYGFIEAKIKKISTSSIQRKEVGLVYEVFLEINKEYLLYNDKKKILKPGMTITAELKVGKRRVIEFFIYPAIKYLHEGMSII